MTVQSRIAAVLFCLFAWNFLPPTNWMPVAFAADSTSSERFVKQMKATQANVRILLRSAGREKDALGRDPHERGRRIAAFTDEAMDLAGEWYQLLEERETKDNKGFGSFLADQGNFISYLSDCNTLYDGRNQLCIERLKTMVTRTKSLTPETVKRWYDTLQDPKLAFSDLDGSTIALTLCQHSFLFHRDSFLDKEGERLRERVGKLPASAVGQSMDYTKSSSEIYLNNDNIRLLTAIKLARLADLFPNEQFSQSAFDARMKKANKSNARSPNEQIVFEQCAKHDE